MKFLCRRLILILTVVSMGATMSACSVLGILGGVTISYDTAGLVEEEPYEGKTGSSFRLPVPEHAEYEFEGWYYDSEFLHPCGKIISLDRSRTLYAKWTKIAEEWSFAPRADGTAFKVTGYSGTDAYVRIPSEYEGKPVTALGARFLGARAMKVHGVLIPDTVTEIEDNAFYNTAFLEEIEIPAGVTKLGSRVFEINQNDYRYVLRKFVYIDGDPAVEKDTFADQIGSFQLASVVAGENTRAYRAFRREKSVNEGVVDATGIDGTPTKTSQYGAHFGAGSEHTLAYDALPSRPAVNASMALHNLRFGYASECAPGSVAARVLDAAREVLYANVSADMTDYDKVHAIYDWVTAAVTYDRSVLTDDDDWRASAALWLDAAYNLEGVFLNRTAVCDGISKAVELLCRMEGIECVRVIGESSGTGHAWNKVRLDGEWYLLDATFGDSALEWRSGLSVRGGEFTDHAMMLATDDAYHTPDPPFMQGYEATDGARSYFTSTVYGGGYDLRLDSQDETEAFLDEYAQSLRDGEVVNFEASTPYRTGFRNFKTDLDAGLRLRGLSDCKLLETANGSYLLLPATASAAAA